MRENVIHRVYVTKTTQKERSEITPDSSKSLNAQNEKLILALAVLNGEIQSWSDDDAEADTVNKNKNEIVTGLINMIISDKKSNTPEQNQTVTQISDILYRDANRSILNKLDESGKFIAATLLFKLYLYEKDNEIKSILNGESDNKLDLILTPDKFETFLKKYDSDNKSKLGRYQTVINTARLYKEGYFGCGGGGERELNYKRTEVINKDGKQQHAIYFSGDFPGTRFFSAAPIPTIIYTADITTKDSTASTQGKKDTENDLIEAEKEVPILNPDEACIYPRHTNKTSKDNKTTNPISSKQNFPGIKEESSITNDKISDYSDSSSNSSWFQRIFAKRFSAAWEWITSLFSSSQKIGVGHKDDSSLVLSSKQPEITLPGSGVGAEDLSSRVKTIKEKIEEYVQDLRDKSTINKPNDEMLIVRKMNVLEGISKIIEEVSENKVIPYDKKVAYINKMNTIVDNIKGADDLTLLNYTDIAIKDTHTLIGDNQLTSELKKLEQYLLSVLLSHRGLEISKINHQINQAKQDLGANKQNPEQYAQLTSDKEINVLKCFALKVIREAIRDLGTGNIELVSKLHSIASSIYSNPNIEGLITLIDQADNLKNNALSSQLNNIKKLLNELNVNNPNSSDSESTDDVSDVAIEKQSNSQQIRPNVSDILNKIKDYIDKDLVIQQDNSGISKYDNLTKIREDGLEAIYDIILIVKLNVDMRDNVKMAHINNMHDIANDIFRENSDPIRVLQSVDKAIWATYTLNCVNEQTNKLKDLRQSLLKFLSDDMDSKVDRLKRDLALLNTSSNGKSYAEMDIIFSKIKAYNHGIEAFKVIQKVIIEAQDTDVEGSVDLIIDMHHIASGFLDNIKSIPAKIEEAACSMFYHPKNQSSALRSKVLPEIIKIINAINNTKNGDKLHDMNYVFNLGFAICISDKIEEQIQYVDKVIAVASKFNVPYDKLSKFKEFLEHKSDDDTLEKLLSDVAKNSFQYYLKNYKSEHSDAIYSYATVLNDINEYRTKLSGKESVNANSEQKIKALNAIEKVLENIETVQDVGCYFEYLSFIANTIYVYSGDDINELNKYVKNAINGTIQFNNGNLYLKLSKKFEKLWESVKKPNNVEGSHHEIVKINHLLDGLRDTAKTDDLYQPKIVALTLIKNAMSDILFSEDKYNENEKNELIIRMNTKVPDLCKATDITDLVDCGNKAIKFAASKFRDNLPSELEPFSEFLHDVKCAITIGMIDNFLGQLSNKSDELTKSKIKALNVIKNVIQDTPIIDKKIDLIIKLDYIESSIYSVCSIEELITNIEKAAFIINDHDKVRSLELSTIKVSLEKIVKINDLLGQLSNKSNELTKSKIKALTLIQTAMLDISRCDYSDKDKIKYIDILYRIAISLVHVTDKVSLYDCVHKCISDFILSDYTILPEIEPLEQFLDNAKKLDNDKSLEEKIIQNISKKLDMLNPKLEKLKIETDDKSLFPHKDIEDSKNLTIQKIEVLKIIRNLILKIQEGAYNNDPVKKSRVINRMNTLVDMLYITTTREDNNMISKIAYFRSAISAGLQFNHDNSFPELVPLQEFLEGLENPKQRLEDNLSNTSSSSN